MKLLPLTPEQRQTVEANLGLAHWWAARYCSTGGQEFDGILDAALDGLIRAVQKFRPDRGKLSTYAAGWMRRFIAIQQQRADRRCPSCFSSYPQDSDGEPALPGCRFTAPDPAVAVANRELLDYCRSLLSPVEWQVLVWRYQEGRRFAEIGERLGLTRWQAQERERSIMAELRRRLAHHVEGNPV